MTDSRLGDPNTPKSIGRSDTLENRLVNVEESSPRLHSRRLLRMSLHFPWLLYQPRFRTASQIEKRIEQKERGVMLCGEAREHLYRNDPFG